MIYSIIFKEPCKNVGCEHGIIRFSDKMGFDECDCCHGFVLTEINVTEQDYHEMKDKLELLPF
jgi:hypothetical protein